MNKKYFETKSGSLEEISTKIATEQPTITKEEPKIKLERKTYLENKPGSLEDAAAKVVSEGKELEEVLDEASPTIAKVKDIVKNKQAIKIDGTTVDLFTASAISQVYDKVNDVNKKKMDGMKIIPLANIAMKLLKNEYEHIEEEVLDEFTNFKSITFKPKGKYVSDGKYEIVYDYGRKALVTKKQLNVWLTQKFIEEELKEGGENDRVRELLQKQETKGLSNSEKKELRELIKTISAGMFEDEQLSQNESFVDNWAHILKIKVGDKVKFVDKGGAHFGKKGKVIRDHGDGSYSVEILFPSGRTLTPNNVKNKDIVKEEVLDEASPTIAKVKDIAKNKQAAKIDGTTVDLFTASAISQVYDKVNDVNKKKMDGMKIIPLANIAMKLLKNEYEPVELDDAVIKEKNND